LEQSGFISEGGQGSDDWKKVTLIVIFDGNFDWWSGHTGRGFMAAICHNAKLKFSHLLKGGFW